MKHAEIVAWLKEARPEALSELWQLADQLRHERVGDEVHLRGLVEFSNHCRRGCAYCGLRLARKEIERYRMSRREIMACAHEAVRRGYGSLVLQSGEDPGIPAEWIASLVSQVKSETPLAITLSLGERPLTDYQLWRDAGADRYLLRFETSDKKLYHRIHPELTGLPDRISLLRALKQMGFETGSGIMVGIPGQDYESIARDLELMRELDLDMIGLGPFVPHGDTPLARRPENFPPATRQVPATGLMACKVLALARLLRPDANIPSTTALATLDGERGRAAGLRRGANVLMPNLTPEHYRKAYQIYPEKAFLSDEGGSGGLAAWLETLGRVAGKGPGGRCGLARRAS